MHHFDSNGLIFYGQWFSGMRANATGLGLPGIRRPQRM
jgi:hypothetical protein